jgi:hypothetical protein
MPLAILVIRAFTPHCFVVHQGTTSFSGFANAGSTCLPSVAIALQIVVEQLLYQSAYV